MRRTVALFALAVTAVSLQSAPASAGTDRSGSQRTVTATAETPALYDDEEGGDADADDPAVWVHPRHRPGSLIIGTAKNGGLRVYDLRGREIQSIDAGAGGRFNNVDVVSGFRLGRSVVDLAVVTDRGRDQLRFYHIDPVAARHGRAPLADVTAADVPLLFSRDQAEVADQATGYGLAVYGNHTVVSRRHTTRLGIFQIQSKGSRVTYRATDTLDLPAGYLLPDGTTWTPCAEPGEDPQVEGMVVDAEAGVLYASQEDIGLWRIDLRGDRFGTGERIIERVAEFGAPATYDPVTEECTVTGPGHGGRIHADVEGATIYRTGRTSGYLLISGQGDSTFFVYDRRTNKPLSSFSVTDGRNADGVQHSDGAAATSVPLPGYPRGLLVLHDGENTPDLGRVSTNFKIVDWRSVPLGAHS